MQAYTQLCLLHHDLISGPYTQHAAQHTSSNEAMLVTMIGSYIVDRCSRVAPAKRLLDASQNPLIRRRAEHLT
jgi:predicted oxidoreductase